MTIDEAIKHCEEVADGFDETAQEIARQDENGVHQPQVSWYQDRASSQRQLAEWLKELKNHREIHEILLQTLVDFDLDMCCEDLTDDAEESKICEECCNNQCLNCWVRWAKMKAREVKADDE